MDQREATILFGDLRGFSAIVAHHPPRVVFELLNGCFQRLGEVVARHGGTIDKFIGDAIMAVFWSDPAAPQQHARRAVHCAVDMQLAMEKLNQALRASGQPELYLGIGLSSGEVISGLIGSSAYAARTLIGEDVNVAARIEAFCLRGQILVSETTHARCGAFMEAGAPLEVHVKGRSQAVTVREVHAIPSAGKTVPRQERRRSPRAALRCAFTYQAVANDVVSRVRERGALVDIGYGGAQVELEREVSPLDEIKLELELPLVDHRAADVYARVVAQTPGEARHRFHLEFTSMRRETARALQRLVQLLIQGTAGA